MSDTIERINRLLADHDKHVARYVADGGAAPDYASEKWAEDNALYIIAALRSARDALAAAQRETDDARRAWRDGGGE